MSLLRVSVSLFATIAVISGIVVAAAVWLVLTNPVIVVDAVNEGDISPVVRELAGVVYGALRGILKYL